MKTRILLVILMAGTVLAGDPNDMPNPTSSDRPTIHVDFSRRIVTIKVLMDNEGEVLGPDLWYFARSKVFKDRIRLWVRSIPRLIDDLKDKGAEKWRQRQSLEQTETERTR